MRSFEEIKGLAEAGLGKVTCDLKIENVNLVNVFSEEIYPTNIYIKDKRIVSIDPKAVLQAKEIIDAKNKYAVPGLIDSHIHIETTMLPPESLSAFTLVKGTTTLCVDFMEIANVCGEDGLKAMVQSMEKLPYRILLEVSSRVPTAPGLETTGAVLGSNEVARIMEWKESVSLGELDPSKILFVKDEYLHKIADTLQKRKIVNGHAIGRLGQELNVYASSGISDDHECVNTEELIARLRVGMKVLIREGSSERNLDALITGALENGLNFDNLMFCTDDKHITDILEEGHINYNVNRAIELGVPPIKAIQMGTLNTAKHFRLEDEIGSITPGRFADILLVDTIDRIEPKTVIFQGKVVAQEGRLTEEMIELNYPEWIKQTVTLKNSITAESFKMVSKVNEGRVRVNVIDLIDTQIINKCMEACLPVFDHKVSVDLDKDIVKLAVVERYGKTGGIGIGFVHGSGLKKGAMAFSTSHDHHNIVVMGTNDTDMAAATNEIKRLQGGLATASDGEVKQSMALTIGGLMSEEPVDMVLSQLAVMNQSAEALGCTMTAPFMALSFISLPTVPELGLTDLGLIDVLNHQLIEVIKE